jgi:hypothetical protein
MRNSATTPKTNSLSKRKRIVLKCLECSGDSPKEVTLCHLFDCPLWPVRTGSDINSKLYRKRIESAFRRYRRDLDELRAMEVDVDRFLPHSAKRQHAEIAKGERAKDTETDEGEQKEQLKSA